MPRYNVEWEWTIGWTVEAESKEIAEACALDKDVIYDVVDQLGDPYITVTCPEPSKLSPPPDAVAVDGTLLAPEDAIIEWNRLIRLEEQKKIEAFEALSGNLFSDDELNQIEK